MRLWMSVCSRTNRYSLKRKVPAIAGAFGSISSIDIECEIYGRVHFGIELPCILQTACFWLADDLPPDVQHRKHCLLCLFGASVRNRVLAMVGTRHSARLQRLTLVQSASSAPVAMLPEPQSSPAPLAADADDGGDEAPTKPVKRCRIIEAKSSESDEKIDPDEEYILEVIDDRHETHNDIGAVISQYHVVWLEPDGTTSITWELCDLLLKSEGNAEILAIADRDTSVE